MPVSTPVERRDGGVRAVGFARLVTAASRGDERAWEQVVRALTPSLRRALAGYKLSVADRDDVLQTTWLRVYSRLHTLRTPEAFTGWVIVTARREALRSLQRLADEILVDDLTQFDVGSTDMHVEALLAAERGAALRAAVGRLPVPQQRLLAWMLDHPDATYSEISAGLAMPIGSIGPTRERALARIRQDTEFAALAAG